MKRLLAPRWIWVITPYCVCLGGCSQAPAYDVMGSLFPAWLVCIAVGGLLSATIRVMLLRLRINLFFPLLAYPCLAAVFTFTIWLICY
jgi:YtcA family